MPAGNSCGCHRLQRKCSLRHEKALFWLWRWFTSKMFLPEANKPTLTSTPISTCVDNGQGMLISFCLLLPPPSTTFLLLRQCLLSEQLTIIWIDEMKMMNLLIICSTNWLIRLLLMPDCISLYYTPLLSHLSHSAGQSCCKSPPYFICCCQFDLHQPGGCVCSKSGVQPYSHGEYGSN